MIYNELLETYFFQKKCHLGETSDGGHVICELDGRYDSYISCGVTDKCGFDEEFLQKYNYIKKHDTFALDGNINNTNLSNEKINRYLKFISNKNDNLNTNLHDLIDNYSNIFLSMDVEGLEYIWLQSLTLQHLKSFKQIVIELHNLNDNNKINNALMINGLEKLNKTHYIMHAHGNNYSGINNNIPNVLELTFVRKDYFKDSPIKNMVPLPIKYLDCANNSDQEDHKLRVYPFIDQVYDRIYIGPSEHNIKEVHLKKHYASDTQFLFFHNFMDTYVYKLVASNILLIKRIDQNCGWGQELFIYVNNNNNSVFSLVDEKESVERTEPEKTENSVKCADAEPEQPKEPVQRAEPEEQPEEQPEEPVQRAEPEEQSEEPVQRAEPEEVEQPEEQEQHEETEEPEEPVQRAEPEEVEQHVEQEEQQEDTIECTKTEEPEYKL